MPEIRPCTSKSTTTQVPPGSVMRLVAFAMAMVAAPSPFRSDAGDRPAVRPRGVAVPVVI